MATYHDWNQALASYFTSGIPRGTKVYLSVDDDILDRIGGEFDLDLTADTWSEDFLLAVRARVFREERLDIDRVCGCDVKDYPQSIAFLATTVLAAYQMAEEEEIDETNYFQRLKELFTITTKNHRPPGLKTGSEERLWKEWNQWLMQQGFLPSAQQGRSTRDKFINYPISQSLLRRTDKDRLRLLFNEKQWKKHWDEMTLFANVRREAPRLSQHLKQLLEDRPRYEAVAETIYEVYQQWLEYPERSAIVTSAGIRTRSRYLLAGLYRTEDPFLGQVDYSLYPKQQRGRQMESIFVQQGDTIQLLKQERPGWYFPLESPLNASELDRGARYDIRENPTLHCVILPQRDFWILIPDPDNPDSGVYAAWGTPPLGTPFILLCKQELLSDLERLRDERLIEWEGEPISAFENSNWVELDRCMVISQAWDGVFIDNSELKEALHPSVRLSISLSGGLRVPQQNAWLEGHLPEIAVFGFSPTVQLTIARISDNQQISFEPSIKTNNKISIEFPGTGDYLIEANAESALSQRLVRILPWDELAFASTQRHEKLPIASEYRICGSIIERDSESG